MIPIEIAYALPDQQIIISLSVAIGCTVEAAIMQSGILERFPSINFSCNQVGIFGQVVAMSQLLNAGDRIEIYRPLTMDPKQARFERVRNAKRKFL